MELKYVVSVVLISLQYLLFFFWIYWLFISLFGFGKPLKQKTYEPYNRFLLLVPAHNEERVIAQLLENLNNLDYPKTLYQICVIADNCNDTTADMARKAGATVIEHTYIPGEPKGKPHAIKYAVTHYGASLSQFDAVAFFDADNLVTLNYLREMNNHLLNGDRLIQCYLDTKNPDDNWITLSYATSYYYMNRSWQLAKSKLGLGNAIGGTGFCVETKLLVKIGWTVRSLTEDLEFTMQCLLEGVPAKWCHTARVFDEKPESFRASVSQRLRWVRGHWDVNFRYTHKLLWRAISKLDFLSFDGAVYLVNPGKIILNTVTSALLLASFFFKSHWFGLVFHWHVWLFIMLFQFAYIGFAISTDSEKKINIIKSYMSMVVFNLSYIPLFFWALLTFTNKTWNPTKHTKSVDFKTISINGK